jgi:hypothetical protein
MIYVMLFHLFLGNSAQLLLILLVPESHWTQPQSSHLSNKLKLSVNAVTAVNHIIAVFTAATRNMRCH